jgi:hypothetical protein
VSLFELGRYGLPGLWIVDQASRSSASRSSASPGVAVAVRTDTFLLDSSTVAPSATAEWGCSKETTSRQVKP